MAGPYTFVAADALVLKVREDGRVVNVHALIAVGVNAEGYREIQGIEVSTAEDGAGWLTFLRLLTVRGLSGVKWPRATPTRQTAGRHRRHPGGGGLAALPRALCHQPDGRHPEVVVAVGAHVVAFGLRSA
jgi:putative transposase